MRMIIKPSELGKRCYGLKGSYECLLQRKRGYDGKILYLIDLDLGAATLNNDDVVLYQSPLYDERKHRDFKYGWLSQEQVETVLVEGISNHHLKGLLQTDY